MDPLEYAGNVVACDPMASFLGISLVELSRGYARLSLGIRREYTNALGMAHGMALCSLADQAVAVAANTLGSSGVIIELKVNYLKAIPEARTLYAEASAVDIKKSISLWRVQLQAEDKTLIATAEGLVYHRDRTSSGDSNVSEVPRE